MGDIKKDLQILSNRVDGIRQKVFFLSSATRVGHEDEEFLDPDSMKGLSRILDGVGLDIQYMAEHLDKTIQKM